ncbi:MAG: hypothetical protein C0507_14290 [Cyanobacteria bacterium PR.3.49]|nr:hypothetical protein [Cyanobacteria bacterium PR.3.49]
MNSAIAQLCIYVFVTASPDNCLILPMERKSMSHLLVIETIPFASRYAVDVAKAILPREGNLHIHEAKNGTEGWALIQQLSPDMVIIDPSEEGSGGLKLAHDIWKSSRKTKILFWLNAHREAYVGELAKRAPLEAVYGYVLKTEGEEKLRYAMMAVFLHNNQYTDPAVRASMVRPVGRSDFLSDAEMETLVDIAVGLTDRAIAIRRGLTVRGVQNRLSTLALKILRKDHWKLRQSSDLEVFNPRTRIVMEALRRGYVRVDQLQAAELDCEEWLNQSQMAKPTTGAKSAPTQTDFSPVIANALAVNQSPIQMTG